MRSPVFSVTGVSAAAAPLRPRLAASRWAVGWASRPRASCSMHLGQRASAPNGASAAPHFAHRSVGIDKIVDHTLLQQKRHEPYRQNVATAQSHDAITSIKWRISRSEEHTSEL